MINCRHNLIKINYTYFMIIGVILVALFYMCQDFPTIDEHQWFQKLIISTMLGGAIASALLAISRNNILGRKKLIIFFNTVGVITIVAQTPSYIVIG